jgi:uncharacterized protein
MNHLPIQLWGMGLSLLLLGCSTSSIHSTAPAVAQVAAEPQQALPITAKATYKDQVIQLEVAKTPDQQETGLMNRPPLPDDRGMLFPFEPPRPVVFWMKNTPSPLDMVFLLNGEVKAIAANAEPCTADPCATYGSGTAVNQVIELRSGRAAELGLAVGDRVTIEFLDSPSP